MNSLIIALKSYMGKCCKVLVSCDFTKFLKSKLNLKFRNYYKTFKLQRAICHFNMEKGLPGCKILHHDDISQLKHLFDVHILQSCLVIS